MKVYIICIFVIFSFIYNTCSASNFYVDPIKGNIQGDGSAQNPWSTMQAVWDENKIHTQYYSSPYDSANPTLLNKNLGAPVQPGDTIYLLSGYHGSLNIVGAINASPITIKAAEGAIPTFKNISITSGKNWVFDGVSISPSYAPVYSNDGALFKALDHSYSGPSSNITIKNSNIFSVTDISGWSKEDWIDKASSGISSQGDYTVVENVTINNVGEGISLYGAPYTTIRENNISNICYDGLRVVGSDFTKVEYNTIKNVYTVVDYSLYHYDLIQAWTLDGDMDGVEIRGNILIAHENPNQPFKDIVQGIGFFDGWFNNFIIENNVVVTDGYHGISLYGANNSVVRNNTVIGTPINVCPHKNGSPGTENVIRNNFAGSISIINDSVSSGTVVDNNIAGFVQSDHFNNPLVFDFSLKAGSSAINAGSALLSPTIDIKKRNRDAMPDIGAHEFFRRLGIKIQTGTP